MSSRQLAALGAAAAFLVLAVAVFLVLRPSAPHGGVPAAPSASPTRLPPAQLKPEVSGLLDRAGVPSTGVADELGGFVVNAKWSDLQPSQGMLATTAIDQALDATRRHNAASPAHPWGIKLRIFAGISAPDWLKAMDGGPVPVQDLTGGGHGGTVGHFWTADFGTAYVALMQALASRYDSVPEIRDVTISRCTTVFAEPMIRQVSNSATTTSLLAAGYTAEADHTCQTQQIDEAASAWKHTHLSLSFNPYQSIDAGGGAHVDEAFTEHVMDYCRSHLGPQCVLENNSIRYLPIGAYSAMYAAMQRRGAPIVFQTATAAKVGSLSQTLQWAIGVGAQAVELPTGYQRLLTSTQLRQFDASLRSAARS